MQFSNIKIVLIETSHTGNMGSAARAMKTMGLTNLCLVNPIIKPDSQSISLAAGASDVIKNAQIVNSFKEAIADCELVIGTSARSRHLQWPNLSVKECSELISTKHAKSNVAIVFGRERIGLTNDELQQCNYHVSIDANPEYCSLNLAMTVQIICYEVRQALLQNENQTTTTENNFDKIIYPTNQELALFYQHLDNTLDNINFTKKNHPGKIINRLKRLFTRAQIEQQELNILRGILSAIDKINIDKE